MRSLIVAAWVLQAATLPAPPAASIETLHLQLKTSASVATVAPGGKVTLQVAVTPKAKMHVYAPGQEGYIPIQLTLTADPAFTAGKAKYPDGEKYVMPALNETQLVYAKPFAITQDITLKSPPSGPLTVKGSVRYQACDEAICYLPKTVPIEWTIAVK
jgi:hypothetical protein